MFRESYGIDSEWRFSFIDKSLIRYPVETIDICDYSSILQRVIESFTANQPPVSEDGLEQ